MARPTRYCAKCGEYVNDKPVTTGSGRNLVTRNQLVHISGDGAVIHRNHRAVEAVPPANTLQALIAHCQNHIESVRGWENSIGMTCDELGCAICNADSAEDAAHYWMRAIKNGDAEMPDDIDEIVSSPTQPIRLP